MALTIPLFYRPGSILFLDDDTDYLEMLGMVIPSHWQAELFSRPTGFEARMRDEPTRWETDAQRQVQMVESWRQGQALVPQVLRYWADHPERYALARTCVVDYAMPGTNGLTVLNNMIDWPGSRVLLTGQADEQIAVQAFNDGLIDQFVPKQATDITRHLLSTLRKLGHAAHPRLNAIWRGSLRPAQQSLLQIASVAKALQNHTQQNWVEYVVLGEPFGLLGLDAQGRVQWLQLETADGLRDLSELGATIGLRYDVTRAIEAGQCLAAIELHQQMGLSGPVRTAPAQEIGNDGVLFGALFSIDPADLPAPILGYREHLQRHDTRQVQDS